MDITNPSYGLVAGSIPAEGTIEKKWAHKVPIINQQSNISENAVMPQVDNHNSLLEESLNEHMEFP